MYTYFTGKCWINLKYFTHAQHTHTHTHLPGKIIWSIVRAQPQPEAASLQLSSHQGIELQGGAQPCPLLPNKLHLRGQQTLRERNYFG